jgi:hypothetical protein
LLIRNDRHGHCIEPIVDTYADSRTYSDSNSDSHAYADSNTGSHTYSDIDAGSHTYANSNSYSHTYANSHIHANGNTYTNGLTYADSHADALYGKMFTDTEAASDSGAASRVSRSDGRHAHSRSYTKRHPWSSCSCSS